MLQILITLVEMFLKPSRNKVEMWLFIDLDLFPHLQLLENIENTHSAIYWL